MEKNITTNAVQDFAPSEARGENAPSVSSGELYLKRQKGRNSGFTLIELLIVIAILAGLGSILIINFPGAQKRARDTQRKSDIKQYQTALEIYANKNNGSYPSQGPSYPITNFCLGTLSITNCPDDPKAPAVRYLYSAVSSGAGYFAWAQLEIPDDTSSPPRTKYFVVCSDGQAGETTTNPASSSSCPL